MVAKRTQHVAPNNVVKYRVEMLRASGRGFQRRCCLMLSAPIRRSKQFNATYRTSLAQYLQALVKRSQHFDATLLGATSCVCLAVCWDVSRYVRPRPNGRNMSTQHIAILLTATCCARMTTVLRRGQI